MWAIDANHVSTSDRSERRMSCEIGTELGLGIRGSMSPHSAFRGKAHTCVTNHDRGTSDLGHLDRRARCAYRSRVTGCE